MGAIKRLNADYSGGIPEAVGDRYYAQDLGRDFNSILDFQSRIMKAIVNNYPQLLRGGILEKGTNYDDLNITASFGIVGHAVTTPDDFSSLPPTTQSEDIEAMIVESDAQVNFDLTATATLDGVTINYVKLRYKESDGASRNRAKKSGSYVYEKEPSFEIIVNTTAPTAYDCPLGTLIGDGSTFLTITQEPPYFEYEYDYPGTVDINFGNCLKTSVRVDLSSGNVSIPQLNTPNYVGQKIHIYGDGANIGDIAGGTGLYTNGVVFTENTGGVFLEAVDNDGTLEWRAINTVTAKYTDGLYKLHKRADGEMRMFYKASSLTQTTTATGSSYFTNAVLTFPENFADTTFSVKPSVLRNSGAIWAGGYLNKAVGGISLQVIGSASVADGYVEVELRGLY